MASATKATLVFGRFSDHELLDALGLSYGTFLILNEDDIALYTSALCVATSDFSVEIGEMLALGYLNLDSKDIPQFQDWAKKNLTSLEDIKKRILEKDPAPDKESIHFRNHIFTEQGKLYIGTGVGESELRSDPLPSFEAVLVFLSNNTPDPIPLEEALHILRQAAEMKRLPLRTSLQQKARFRAAEKFDLDSLTKEGATKLMFRIISWLTGTPNEQIGSIRVYPPGYKEEDPIDKYLLPWGKKDDDDGGMVH